MSRNVPSWRSFDDSPAGKLLGRIYGPSQPHISYPVLPASKPSAAQHDRPFLIPGGGQGSVDLKSATRKQKSIKIPRFGSSATKGAACPARCEGGAARIPRRRPAAAIEAEIAEISVHNQYYRPPCTKPLATEQEKERLAEIFTHRGGKALPEELLHPVGPTPTELAHQREAKRDLLRRRAKRAGRPEVCEEEESSTPAAATAKDALFDHILSEIDERVQHLRDMEQLGQGAAVRHRLNAELAARLRQLEKLDKVRSTKLREEVHRSLPASA